MTDISQIWQFDLRRGNSSSPRDGACLLDAVSWFEYGKLGDRPACVCPVIAAFARGINDILSDDARQRLKVYIPRLVGTVDPSAEQARAEYLAWRAIRVFAPLALDAIDLRRQAEALRSFDGPLRAAYTAIAAARDAAGAAETNGVKAAVGATNAAIRAAAYAIRATTWATAYAAAYAAVDTYADTTGAAYADTTGAAYADTTGAAYAAAHATRAAVDATNAATMPAITAAIEHAAIVALEGVLRIGRKAEPIAPERMVEAARSFAIARTSEAPAGAG